MASISVSSGSDKDDAHSKTHSVSPVLPPQLNEGEKKDAIEKLS